MASSKPTFGDQPFDFNQSQSGTIFLNGVFSGFVKPVMAAAKEYGVDAKEIFIELGRRKVVAGQENLIIEVAQELLQRDSTL